MDRCHLCGDLLSPMGPLFHMVSYRPRGRQVVVCRPCLDTKFGYVGLKKDMDDATPEAWPDEVAFLDPLSEVAEESPWTADWRVISLPAEMLGG